MIRITETIAIDPRLIEEHFVRASGPGGQNVNKVATAVQLRFDVAHSASLPLDVRARLVRLAGARMTGDGVLIIQAGEFRSQERNRQAALARLIDLICRAAVRPKKRKATRPSFGSQQRRVETKRRRAKVKQSRRGPGLEL